MCCVAFSLFVRYEIVCFNGHLGIIVAFQAFTHLSHSLQNSLSFAKVLPICFSAVLYRCLYRRTSSLSLFSNWSIRFVVRARRKYIILTSRVVSDASTRKQALIQPGGWTWPVCGSRWCEAYAAYKTYRETETQPACKFWATRSDYHVISGVLPHVRNQSVFKYFFCLEIKDCSEKILGCNHGHRPDNTYTFKLNLYSVQFSSVLFR